MKTEARPIDIATQILTGDDVESEPISLPKWGEGFEVRSMTIAQRKLLEDHMRKGRKGDEAHPNSRELLVVYTLYRDGKLVFSPSHVDQLAEKNSGYLEKICNVAMRVNCMGSNTLEAAVKK